MANGEGEAEQLPPYTLEEFTALLTPFRANNPNCEFEFVPEGEKTNPHVRLLKPWSDPTVLVLLVGRPDDTIAALNRLLLPAKFSAIWHVATSRMEVIWTAGKLAAHQEEIAGRAFTLSHEGREYSCKFDNSSDDLVTLARTTFPDKGTSETNLRNIQTFYQYATIHADKRERYGIDKPRSFWIEGFTGAYDEEAAVELARKINFFLTYYDRRSPSVLIHADALEQGELAQPVRYIAGSFPETITAPAAMDENLIAFWSAANGGNEILRFMLYYRIIEYAAFHFMETQKKTQIKRILTDPAAAANVDDTASRMMAVLSGAPADDARIDKLLSAAVAVEVLWKEIDANRASFQTEVILDGGFLVPALIGPNDNLDNFRTMAITKVTSTLRKIRNCLSHGKDQTSATVITPTVRNLRALRPWVHLIAKAAGEVVIYKDAA